MTKRDIPFGEQIYLVSLLLYRYNIRGESWLFISPRLLVCAFLYLCQFIFNESKIFASLQYNSFANQLYLPQTAVLVGN